MMCSRRVLLTLVGAVLSLWMAAPVALIWAADAVAYKTNLVEGWTVLIDGRLLNDQKADTEKALELLRVQLQEIALKVPAPAVAQLKKVNLWFSPEYPGVKPRAEYHPDPKWLRDNRRNPAMAKGVEFSDIRNFEKETRRMPNFTLHELAHAYHDRVLTRGFGNEEIKAAYERAKASGSYTNVERWFGNGRPNTREKAYAMVSPMEYFAETTEAFFSRNDFFPFTRSELQQHDPEMDELLGKLWGASLPILVRGEAPSEVAPHGKGNVYAPSIVVDGELWRMWYGGQGKDGHDRIHYAESRDGGKTWKKRGVVLENGSANHVNDPSVVKVGAEWFMFYTVAERGTEDAIALAVSRDGVQWEKKGVVLGPGPKGTWDSRLVGRPSVLYENGAFRMWYDGQPTKEDRSLAKLKGARAVGLATSKDGIHWTRHRSNPVLQRVGAVDVARVEEGYILLYEERSGIGAATSSDGIEWQDKGLVTGLSGSDADKFGRVTPHLVKSGKGWEIFFGAASRKSWDGNSIASAVLPGSPHTQAKGEK